MKIKFKLTSANYPVRVERRNVKFVLMNASNTEIIGYEVRYAGYKNFIVNKHEVIEVTNDIQI